MYAPFFYKNSFYKNRQAQNWPRSKNLVRIIPRLTIYNLSVKAQIMLPKDPERGRFLSFKDFSALESHIYG